MATRSLGAILRRAAHANDPDEKGRTPVHLAARRGNADELSLLIRNGGDIHLGDNTGERPLQMAVRKGWLDCVRVLIREGADVNHMPPPELSNYSETALCSTARHSRREDSIRIMEHLLLANADPNAATSARRFPMHAAAWAGSVTMVQLLLSHGAIVDTLDHDGSTPLLHAVNSNSGHPDVVRLLLQASANPNAIDRRGMSVLFHAIDASRINPALLSALLTANVDLTGTEPMWKLGAIAHAARRGLDDAVTLLRKAGAPEPETPIPPPTKSHLFRSADGRTTEFEVCEGEEVPDCIYIDESDEPPPPDLDADAAPRWLLESSFGWLGSESHWRMLAAPKNPLAIIRLAYCARCCFNKPAGKEMDDGPAVLGESYQSAADRFVSLGLFEVCKPAVAAIPATSSRQLKELAAAEGIKGASWTKQELVHALISKIGPDQLTARLSIPTHYTLTAAGHALIADRAQQRRAVLAGLGTQLRDHISKGDFPSSWKTLMLIRHNCPGGGHIISAIIRPNASKAGKVQDAITTIPPATPAIPLEDLPLWRACAVLTLVGAIPREQWPDHPWLPIPQQCLEDGMSPEQVASLFARRGEEKEPTPYWPVATP